MSKADEFEEHVKLAANRDGKLRAWCYDNQELITRALRQDEALSKAIDGLCASRGYIIDALLADQDKHYLTGEARTACDDVLSVLVAFREAVK